MPPHDNAAPPAQLAALDRATLSNTNQQEKDPDHIIAAAETEPSTATPKPEASITELRLAQTANSKGTSHDVRQPHPQGQKEKGDPVDKNPAPQSHRTGA